MINYISLLGACALTAFSAPINNNIETNSNDIVIGGTEAWQNWTDQTDYDYSFTLSQSTSYLSWKSGSTNYNTNYFFYLSYYDYVDNVFRGFESGSTSAFKGVTECINLSYEYIEGGLTTGMFLYYSRSSSNPNNVTFYIGFVSNYIGGANFYISEAFGNSFNYVQYQTRVIYPNDLLTYVLSSNITAYSDTLTNYLRSRQGLSASDTAYIHESQVISYLPLGGAIYKASFTNGNTDLDNYFNQTLTYKFVNANNADSQEAYSQGYNQGLSEGTAQGYQTGYAQGFSDADNMDSTALTIFTGIINVALVPVNFFLQVLNFEVFGINIAGLVTSFMTIAIVMFFWRMFAGGKNDD